jgi:drug/metabolite transporter (DMT)-like permease
LLQFPTPGEKDHAVSEAVVVAVVLLAAVLHAAWNAVVKHSGERLLTFATVIGTGALAYVPVAFFVEPPRRESIPYLVGSLTIHLFYYAGLLYGYRYGDLGQVYPIARGTGPLLVAIVSAPLAGERLGLLAMLGVGCVSLGIFSLATRRPGDDGRGIVFALLTGITIAGYTVCDGLGVRAAGSKLGYIAFLHVGMGLSFSSIVMLLRWREVPAFFRAHGKQAFLGGLVACLAYSLVIWAMSGTQLAYVASLREISVIIAALLGTLVLKEPFGKKRVLAAAVIAAGIALIAIGR